MLESRGFTIIELLVVMAVIGLIIALAVIGLQVGESNSIDTARKDIASQLNVELQAWYDQHGKYPDGATLFVGTTGNYFLQDTRAAGCSSGYMVNNTCVNFESMQINASTIQYFTANGSPPCTTPATISGGYFYLCYVSDTANTSYTLYTYLQSGGQYRIH